MKTFVEEYLNDKRYHFIKGYQAFCIDNNLDTRAFSIALRDKQRKSLSLLDKSTVEEEGKEVLEDYWLADGSSITTYKEVEELELEDRSRYYEEYKYRDVSLVDLIPKYLKR